MKESHLQSNAVSGSSGFYSVGSHELNLRICGWYRKVQKLKQNQKKGFFLLLLFSCFLDVFVLENIQVSSSHDLAGKIWTNLELKIIGSVLRDKSVVLNGGKTTTTTNLYLEVWIASEICHGKPVVTGHHPMTVQEIKGPVRPRMGETK